MKYYIKSDEHGTIWQVSEEQGEGRIEVETDTNLFELREQYSYINGVLTNIGYPYDDRPIRVHLSKETALNVAMNPQLRPIMDYADHVPKVINGEITMWFKDFENQMGLTDAEMADLLRSLGCEITYKNE